jgi:hypothetical protein
MAKQTFTTGQVLTAAQMTSLQQTAMGGGSATAKTASYVLVAADAGTTIIMNSGSATTITVNTSLFSAGDTVFVVNQGAGVCTITAGTATVSSAGTLAMSQNETGQLYFLSASAAIFTEYTQTAASSGGMTELASGSLSGNSLSLSSISAGYKDLRLVMRDWYWSGVSGVFLRFNGDTASNYQSSGYTITTNTTSLYGGTSSRIEPIAGDAVASDNNNAMIINIYDYANTSSKKLWSAQTSYYANGNVNFSSYLTGGWLATPAAVNAISVAVANGAYSYSGGTYILYGVN